ncbi:MAG: hypothetical protein AB8G14_03400 [Ilumatobacter sp.]
MTTQPPATGSPVTDPAPPDTTPPDTTSPPVATPPDTTPAPDTDPPATEPPTTVATTSAADLAVLDLAARLNRPASDITVKSVEEVTWRSGAIGCPQKDFSYTQALVPGIRLQLLLDGRRYQYHAGGGRDPFYCVDPEPPASS